METKKEKRVDLNRISGLFLSIGFLVSISLVITAFEWRFDDDRLVDLVARKMDPWDVMIKVPVTEIKPLIPPAPRPQPVEVKDTEEVEKDLPFIDIDLPGDAKIPELPPLIATSEEDTDVPFSIVEEPASPKGGWRLFYLYVKEQMNGKYPPQARRMGIEGRVFVEFIVEKDGSLAHVLVVKGIGGGCDELAIKVIAFAPPWNPGKQRGKPVRQRCTLPIIFKLG